MGDAGEKVVPVGPDYQAFLPILRPLQPLHSNHGSDSPVIGRGMNWKPVGETDEHEWLGQQVWPLPGGQAAHVTGRSFRQPGKGREDDCGCASPGSLECVRLHVKEADEKLKIGLGAAYFEWRLPEMGEKYADSWTESEEDSFISTVQWYPKSRNSNFWSFLEKTVPGRTRQEKVCYYYNVFVLRRRAAQNRLYPEVDIDSDDDDTNLFNDETDGSEDFCEDDGILSSVDMEGEDAFLMEVVLSGEDESRLTESSTSPVRGMEPYQSMLQPESGNEFTIVDQSSGEDRSILYSGSGSQDSRLGVRKDDETDMDESEDDQPTEKDCWDKQPWGSGFHFREVHPLQDSGLGTCDDRGVEHADPGSNISVIEFPLDAVESIEHCDLGAWVGTMDMHSRIGDDRLISTNGVMKELFGDSAGHGWDDNDRIL